MVKYSIKHKLLFIALLSFSFIGLSGIAKAAPPASPAIPTNVIPSAGDFSQGSSVSLITAIYGNGYVLDSPTSTVRLYSPSKSNTVNIINGADCPGPTGDVGPDNSQVITTYYFYSVNPDALNGYNNTPYGSNRTLLKTVNNKQIGCNNNSYPVSFTSGESAVGVGPATGQYAIEIVAVMSNVGGPGWNQFKYQVSAGGGRLSYYAGAGDHFAVKAVDGAPGEPGNYNFGFAPGCGLKPGQTEDATLRWFDEDAGQSNQGGVSPVETVITEYDASNNPTGYVVPIVSINGAQNGGYQGAAGPDGPGNRIINIITGNNVGGSVTIKIRAHHKYNWEHYRIYNGNGIQFQLPFDSYNNMINYNTDCPGNGAPDASCSATPSTGFPAPNTSITMKVRVTNTSGPGGPTLNNTYEVRQVSPGGQVKNLSGNLSPGSTDNNIPPFGPIAGRPAGTTVVFTYQLFNSSGTAIGSSCSATVTWNPGGVVSGSIDPQCSQTIVSGVNVNDRWHQPAGASPTIPPRNINAIKVDRVPAQVRITDVATGTSFIYNVPNGVPNDGSQMSFNTFGMGAQSGNTMWPHKTYSFQLIIQGNNSFNDSVSYDNNGNWTDAGGTTFYPVTTLPETPTAGDCLHLSCGPATAPDVEPGQTTNFSASINYTNDTNQSYSTNPAGGYYFHIDTNGGLVASPGDVAGGTISNGSGTVSASFSSRIDYTGSYSITFMFQGSPLDLGQGNPCPEQSDTPATRPFLQVWGGDILTGGGFETVDNTGAFSCANSYPSYVSPSITGDANSGGLKTFAAADGTYGSLSDFGALSLGVIAKNDSAHINFGAQPSFANNVAPNGQLNSSPPSYCTVDFYDKTQESPISTGPPAGLSGLGSQQYIVNGNIDNFAGGTVNAGQKTVLYINGDITITSNITYANWDVNNPDSAPSFAIIVKGNINIDPGVTRLDGLYIAQPSSPGSDGQFNTCANNSGNQFCVQQLVVNGAVIARQILPLRSVGTLSPDANPAFAPPPGHNPAEIFNFIPAMITSAPNFAPVYNSLEGLFSLPPVF